MSWKIELTLYTDIERFEAWLDRYWSHTLPFNVELGQGKILHVLSAPTFIATHHGLRKLEIKAFTNEPDPSNPKTKIATQEIQVLEIELFESANNKLNVEVNCKHHKLVIYHIDLLKAIAKMWPEAGEAIFNYIKKLWPEDDKKTETEMVGNPLYYERDIEPATINDVLGFIIELNHERGGISRVIERPEGVFRWVEFKRKEREDNLLAFFAYENSEKKVRKPKQKPVREALGEVIEFKCVNIGEKVKIKATCWVSENPLIAEHFEKLWQELIEFLPTQKEESAENTIREVALNSTGVIAGPEYDNLTAGELKLKAARFDKMRYGKDNKLPAKPPTRKEMLDQACLEWAARGNLGYPGRYSRKEFLQDFEVKTQFYITPDEHKRALRDAESRGLIQKIKGRFRPID